MSFTIEQQHIEFQFYAPQWTLSDAYNKGSRAVVALGEDGILSPYSPTKNATKDKAEYDRFAKAAPFTGITAKTLEGLAGTVTRKSIITDEVQPTLEYLLKNANGNGLSLNQHVNRTIDQVTLKGRFGLLTELPNSDGQASRADNANGLMPSIIGYYPNSIVDWSETLDQEGDFIKLCEIIPKKIDGGKFFNNETETQYRLLLIEDGIYKQRLYKSTAESEEEFEEIPVTFGEGESFKRIPWDWVGAKNNDSTVDDAPMWGIVTSNKSHFFNAGLQQNAATNNSLMMFTISLKGSKEQNDERFKDGLSYGSRQVLLLPENAKTELVQAKDTSAASTLKDSILEEAKLLTGALVEPSSNGTATESNNKLRGDGSVMATVAVNVEDAYNNQLANVSLVVKSNTESLIVVNKELFDNEMTPEMRAKWGEDLTLGRVTRFDYNHAMRKGGMIEEGRTDEDIEKELKKEADKMNGDSIPVTTGE